MPAIAEPPEGVTVMHPLTLLGLDGRAEMYHDLSIQRNGGGSVRRRDGSYRRRESYPRRPGGEVAVNAIQVVAVHVVVAPRHVDAVVRVGQQRIRRREGGAQAVRSNRAPCR